MVTSRSGLAFLACSAANRPAPPAPRMRMSVARWFTLTRPHALQDRGAASHGLVVARGVERAAMRIHGHHQRAEMFDAEAPQTFGMQVVHLDVLDRLDPGGLQRRCTADHGEIGAAELAEGGERLRPHAAFADDDAHAFALHQRIGEALHPHRGGGADAERLVSGRRLPARPVNLAHIRRGVNDGMALQVEAVLLPAVEHARSAWHRGCRRASAPVSRYRRGAVRAPALR